MVGIDPAPNNVAVAARHAGKNGLDIAYHCTTLETLAPLGERYDAVLVMEVVEHVKDVAGFLRDAASMVKPGGLLVGATLNRTAKSYGLAILGAEYLLRWLPRGTHDWHKFVTPDEFEGHLVHAGLTPLARAGVRLQSAEPQVASLARPRLQLHGGGATTGGLTHHPSELTSPGATPYIAARLMVP